MHTDSRPRNRATPPDRSEVAVVGGGHNGLVCAAYLARAGLDVTVLEKNESCGGALFSTVHEGTTLEHGGVDHSTIVASTIPEELALTDHGLVYLDRTASAVHMFGDGVNIAIADTAEETARGIAAVDEADAEAWIELAELSTRMWELIGPLSEDRAVPMDLAVLAGRAALGRRGRTLLELAAMPVTDLAHTWFRSAHMRALAAFRSQFSGLPATHPGTGAIFCLTPGGHGRRFSRPRGGSRAFVAALESAVEGAGGRIETGFAATSVERESDGWRVRAADGRTVHATRAVVSALAPQDMILQLLRPADAVPARLRRRMQQVEVITANLGQFTLASTLEGEPPLAGIDGTGFEGTQAWMLAEPRDFLAHQAAARDGRILDRPAVLATFPSIIDATAAPPGRASLWINGFIARHLAEGRTWSDAAGDAMKRIWATVESCLPGVRDLVSHVVFTSPDDLSERTGTANPGFHLSATLEQSLARRPARGCADHRSGIDGLYLTGAGTNPGPSISGLPGRACAQAVLADVRDGSLVDAARGRLCTVRREWTRVRGLAGAIRRARRG